METIILKKKYLVTKSNILNEFRMGNPTLQELRLFSIYLSRVNPKDINTRKVIFPYDDFCAIMEFKGRVSRTHLESVMKGILTKIITLPREDGGFACFSFFITCEFMRSDDNWSILVDIHEYAIEYVFNLTQNYFKYQLWNVLKLKSRNQLRMYEILKQDEYKGHRELSVKDLKAMLGIEENEYPRFSNFKTYVLDACQTALEKYTDIKFTYEPCGKKGPGGKIKILEFKISKNKNFVDAVQLDKFIGKERIQELSETKENVPVPTPPPKSTPAKLPLESAKNSEINQQFEQFWNLYPRKANKESALKEWNEIAPDDELFRKIMDSLKLACTFWEQPSFQSCFTPYPANWLIKKYWMNADSIYKIKEIVKPARKNDFVNFKDHDRDYVEIEILSQIDLFSGSDDDASKETVKRLEQKLAEHRQNKKNSK
jgi:plasmid replication initiation protein